MTNLPPDFVFTSERPHYSLALFSRAHLAKSSKFASKRTLNYFRKKCPEYANKSMEIYMHFEPIDRFDSTRCVTVCDSVKDQSNPINRYSSNLSSTRPKCEINFQSM